MPELDDLIRLRHEYKDRETRLAGTDTYTYFNQAYLYLVQQRQRALLELLVRCGWKSLHDCRIMELGCGRGGILLEYLCFGADPAYLYGNDLLLDRVVDAHHRLKYLPLLCANGQYLPYADQSFDLILQYTVFSSILDRDIRNSIAQEMLRVVRPRGYIIWYDFWLNPTNRQTRGVRPSEIRQLFPQCTFEFHRITLAPPIVRRLVGTSRLLCQVLEKLTVFNTHYLVAIRPSVNIRSMDR